VLDPKVDAATRTLLDAAGEGSHFGHLIRDPVSGELELVVAIRGEAAKDALRALGRTGSAAWAQRLLRGLVGSRADDESPR
jgi:hypothetical protein